MSTSDRTFNQVKAILSKLDRSIDEIREKRTQGPAKPATAAATPPASPEPTQAPARPGTGRLQATRIDNPTFGRWNPDKR